MPSIAHFRALAAAAGRQAEEATLPSVRERCARSSLAWLTIVSRMLDAEQLASANLAAGRSGS